MADSELESLRNLAAAAVFRLEKSRGTEAMERVLEAAVEWLREPGLEELRKSFTDWVLKVLLPSRLSGVRFPEALDLEEVKAMLAESGFGPLPEEIRRRVEAIASIEELTEFVFRAGAAPSLAALTK